MSATPDQNAASPIFTIGYGNRSVDELIALLLQHQIGYLIDVRSQPYSRFKPEFSREALENRLKQANIKYVFLGDKLGGFPSDESCYTDGRVNYDRCEELPSYREGIARLRSAWEKKLRVSLMCSEGKPEECHRSKLIGRSLCNEQIAVMHIDEAGVLRTQDEIALRVSGGQLNLFGPSPEMLTSRKKYRSEDEEAQDDES